MHQSPLENLHHQFDDALKKHVYMGPATKNAKKLEQTPKKQIRLQEVFQIAQQQIEADLKGQANSKDLEAQITHLRSLDKDGKLYYERYEKATNSWIRYFLKGLAFYTPSFLKHYLPTCFSNKMEDAEIGTKNEHQNYRNFLGKKIVELSQLKAALDRTSPVDKNRRGLLSEEANDILLDEEILDPDQDAAVPSPAVKNKRATPNNQDRDKLLKENEERALKEEEDLGLQKLLLAQFSPVPKGDAVTQPNREVLASPSKEEIEEKRQQDIAGALLILQNQIQALNQFNERPLSLEKYKKVMSAISNQIQSLLTLDSDNAKKLLIDKGLSETAFNILADREFVAAIITDDNPKLLDLLKPTEWHDSFQEALAQKGHIKFGVRRIGSDTALQLTNDQDVRLRENVLNNYRGKIALTLNDSKDQTQTALEELVKLITTKDKFRPHHIEIQFTGPCTPEIFKHLLTLSDYVSEIKFTGLKSINFKDLNLSADEEYHFVQRLDRFICSGLKDVVLSDHPKNDWMPGDFSRFLSVCPKMELLKDFYRLCPTPQNIALPAQLCAASELDLAEYPLEHIPHLLQQFTKLTHVNLKGTQITVLQLSNWMAKGYLAHVETLHLEDCKSLTTDILFILPSLPHLAKLSLPDLPKGTLPLEKLPKFDNPFKIKSFYTTSKATQKIASSLYTGPLTWAAAFQIPLARDGVSEIFTPGKGVLDPKSVAYWLHINDYQRLTPQKAITTILADSNATLSDENIVEFVQKFPNAMTLSLYNCPNVSDIGIIKLLTACPKFRSLDLTGCPHISEALFLGEGHSDILGRLNKLTITNTGISSEIAAIFQEFMGEALIFEESVLKITDDQLTDEAAFEELLKSKELDNLKRIDLTNCTKLSNQMLAKLLDHLNEPLWIRKDEAMVDNPQRLNLDVLNLTGCTAITDEAFDNSVEGDKIQPKLLENLDRIIMGGTQISKVLEEVYPKVVFQEDEKPVTIQMDPEAQLQVCQTYYQKKQLAAPGDGAAQQDLKRLARGFIHNRLTVELFGFDCRDQEAVDKVLNQPIETNAQEFCDIVLSFKPNDETDPVTFYANRDVLYSQSLYFVNIFRPGGRFSKVDGLHFVNQHTTAQAAQVMMDLLYGRAHIEDLDWETASDAAELVGPDNFNLLKTYYIALLKRMHSQFDESRADEMFLAAKMLNDQVGMVEYENTLLLCLDDITEINDQNATEFRKIANLANVYELPKLKAKVKRIEDRQNNRIAKQVNAENEADDKRLLANMMATTQLTHFV